MQPLSVRLIQTYLHWQDPTANRRHLGEVMTQVQGEPDLIVLPETFTTGFLGEVGVAPEETVGPTVEWMREMAVRHGCAICGSAAISENGQTLNRFMFVTVQGLQAYYDKRHLFCIGGESERYTAGAERVVIPYKGWRIWPPNLLRPAVPGLEPLPGRLTIVCCTWPIGPPAGLMPGRLCSRLGQ